MRGALVIPRSQLVVEAPGSGAAAYVRGQFSLAAAARTIAACFRLPKDVRALHADLRAVAAWDIDAILMLESLPVEWSRERFGVHRIAHRRASPRDAFVAVPCAIRDAPDAQLRRECDDRVVSAPPSPI